MPRGVAATCDGSRWAKGVPAPRSPTAKARQGRRLPRWIADNGNEIGCGIIADAVREYKPYGRSASARVGVAWPTSMRLMGLSLPTSPTGAATRWRQRWSTPGPGRPRPRWPNRGACPLDLHPGRRGDGRSGRPVFAADGIPGRFHGYFVDIVAVARRVYENRAARATVLEHMFGCWLRRWHREVGGDRRVPMPGSISPWHLGQMTLNPRVRLVHSAWTSW